jgi:hypothetical protein
MMARAVLVLAGVVFVAGCSSLFGIDEGTYDDLEAEIAATRAELVSLIGDAEILGESVDVMPCDPLDQFQAGVDIVVRSNGASALELRDAIAQQLAPVDVPEVAGLESARRYGLLESGLNAAARPLARPADAVRFGATTRCYSRDRIAAEEPIDLVVDLPFDTSPLNQDQ